MLATQAHSFDRQFRLAVALAWVGGYTNVVALTAFGAGVAHVSGWATFLGRDLARAHWVVAGLAVTVLAGYSTGAFAAGLLIEIGRRKRWRSIFAPPIAIEAVVLATLAVGLDRVGALNGGSVVPDAGLAGLAAIAMGLQNAATSRISSGMVRTTHVTGVVADLGVELALWVTSFAAPFASPRHSRQGLVFEISGSSSTARRITFLAALLASFVGGAALGFGASSALRGVALLVPVAFLAVVLALDHLRPTADVVRDPRVGWGLPDGLEVFVLHPRGARCRFPNLLVWIDREARNQRVIVLSVAAMGVLKTNDVLELCAVMQRLRLRGQILVVAGVSRACFAAIHRAGAHVLLEPLHVVSDVELALALGLALYESRDYASAKA